MKSLNGAWKFLIYIGIASLIGVVAWEFYQVSTGGRADFTLVVVDMPKSTLFTTNLKQHLQDDRLNIVEVGQPKEE